ERVVRVEMDPADPALIRAVITRSTLDGTERRYRGRLFSDCSGDGTVAFAAGAEFMYGTEGGDVFGESLTPPESTREVMGLSVLWTSVEEDTAQPFPDIDWGLEFTEKTCYYRTSGDWETETGQYRDQADEIEYIRDYSLMTTFCNWSYLKNRSEKRSEFANRRIDWISSCGGKRESRRFIGDYVMTQQDIEEKRKPDDGTGCITWSIDLHYPEPENLRRFAEPFRSCAYHRCLPDFAPVPYRCLYSRNVKNLFLGGRLISLSHVAFSAARVMRTLGVFGEVVAMAAKVCCEKNVYCREVGIEYLDRLKELMTAGVPVPEQFNCCAIGNRESYHFKELGHLSYNGSGRMYDLPEQLQKDILQLKRDHLYPETGK
ncbi:MAG: FAD-dependent oxidoreductase, partial [Lentisphaeria bacterium]|nr:FAD-dependent oxidoreductase [Lentisphaeria bacterium]